MTHRPDRRVFLKQAALLAAGASCGIARAEPATDDKTLPIIDTHQHLWDLTRFKLPRLKTQAKLNKSFLMNAYGYQVGPAIANKVKPFLPAPVRYRRLVTVRSSWQERHGHPGNNDPHRYRRLVTVRSSAPGTSVSTVW